MAPNPPDDPNYLLYAASSPQGAIDKWLGSGNSDLKCSRNGLLVPMSVKWRVTGATQTSGAWTYHEIGVSGLDYYPNGNLNSACLDIDIVFGFGTEYVVKCTEVSNRNLSLSIPTQDPKDPYPAGIAGKKSSIDLIAKVTDGSTPKAGVAVSFGVEVEANTGGHDHHDASRPKGEVKASSLKTDESGEIKVTFQASEFSGTHVVAAACSTCTNTSVTKNVDVKVPGLIELQGDYSPSAKYELIGNEKPPGTNHKGNHFFDPEALIALQKLLPIFAQFDWGVVAINDSSLKWGGRFDIAGHWNGSHHEHRDGKEVDISFYKPFGTISEKVRKKVYDDLSASKNVSTPNVLWHLEDNTNTGSRAHFHVYLLGQSSTRTTKY